MYRGGTYWSKSSGKLLQQNTWLKPVHCKLQNGRLPVKTQQCCNSTSSGSGGSSLYISATIATIGALLGGTTTYAGYDNEFRKGIEDALPFSKAIFQTIHGEIQEKKSLLPIEEKDLSIPFEPLVEDYPDSESKPLFSDTFGTPQQADDKNIAVNTLDTQSISMIDLDISNISSADKNKTEDQQEVATEVIEDTEVKTTEVAETISSDTESFVIVDKSEVSEAPTVDSQEALATEIPVSPPAEEDFTISPIEDEKPLSSEEIATLSTLVDQAALEVLVSTSADNIKFLTEQSTALQNEAASALRNYMKVFASALSVSKDDPTYEETLKSVSEIEHSAQEKFDIAKQKEIFLKAEMESLNNLVATVRKSGDSEVADAAEISLNKCTEEIKTGLSEIDVVQQDFDFLLDYQTFTATAPQALQLELNSFAVDLLKLLEEKKVDLAGLSRDQAVLALALKRRELLEQMLEENKAMDLKQVEEMHEKQKVELQQLAEETLTLELRRLESEKNLEQELKIKGVEESYEREMLSQLKRQASAHNEHLSDELASQATDLNTKHQTELDSKLTEQRNIYEGELEKNVACINGIQSKVGDVVDIERRQKRAQEVWIASQALNSTLYVPAMNGRTRTLMPEMISVLQLGERNETLTEIVNSIPEEAALFGVIPEKHLINRFKHVKRECKKVAMVSEGDSLGMYALSYIKSLFVFSRWYLRNAEGEIDLDELSSYEILSKAEYFTQQGDLETAAKFMSQLKGVPRKLCGDWLNEVRLFLETKQTALLLQAYAASLTVGLE